MDISMDNPPPDVAPDVAPDVSDASDAADASDVPSRCTAAMDCRGNPDGELCDTTTGRCVQCDPMMDTCAPSQHCDSASRRCVAGCRSDEGCRESTDGGVADGGPDGSATGGRHDRCDTVMHTCVECATDAHCGPGFLCVGNVCTVGCNATSPCPTGQSCCAGACVDPLANVAHCGMCDRRCAVPNGTAACMNGSCAVGACMLPFGDCDMTAANGCETNTMTSVMHCGMCGRACAAGAHATATCSSGTCGYTCEAGFADCNGVAADGCEVDLNDDVTHCGSCTTLCNPPNGTAGCAMGMCRVSACATGFADCDMNPTNGCEVNTRTNVSHCGMCGTACPERPNSFPGCVGSTCVISCVAGFADCDGENMNGCEVDTRSTVTNCGACGRTCVVAHATAACMTSRCVVGTCDTGYADCNRDPADGCEVNTLVDENNCGACGTRCSTPGGTPVCRAGTCGISMCSTGLEDCNLRASDGCEIDTRTDAMNCGGCGAACRLPHATPACRGGVCAVGTCDEGFADCNGMAADGCEVDTRTSADHCGMCGSACRVTNGTGGCIASVCTIAMCNPGFADCNMRASDGCEVNTTNDPANCGACGRTCAAGLTCQAGLCTRFPSTGAEGAFSPTTSTVLTPGVHNFTTITIPTGVTVRVSGNGVLDLRAVGAVTIDGIIDLSGGSGGSVTAQCSCGTGGHTGTTTAGGNASGPSGCAGGGGGAGTAGANGTGNTTSTGGSFGGGGGGYFGGGAGGGGYSGGNGGAADYSAAGNGRGGGAEVGGGGSALGGVAPPAGGTIAAACYNGGSGTSAANRDNVGSAGGGGSIGANASNDRAVDTTFRTGSGGGGGGGGADEGGCGDGETGGGGGGGGGGALRVATTGRLSIAGAVLANGGNGGVSIPATDDCADDTGQSGGGGSGGVIYLYAPSMAVSGRVTATGGAGGSFTNNSCGVIGTSTGGNGGLGRIRISVDNVTSGACALGGTFNPPLASGCANNTAVCQAYVTRFPD